MLVEISERMGRKPSALPMKLSNLASIDPEFRKTGRKGLEGASEFDRAIPLEAGQVVGGVPHEPERAGPEGEALLAQDDRSASHPSKCDRMAKCCAFPKAPRKVAPR